MDDGYNLCFRGIVKYPDCNASELLFGGKLLAWLDEYVAIEAARQMQHTNVVTKKFGEMIFDTPTELKKILSIYAKVEKKGTTSITMRVIATKSDRSGENEITVSTASIVYVAVDEKGRPVAWN